METSYVIKSADGKVVAGPQPADFDWVQLLAFRAYEGAVRVRLDGDAEIPVATFKNGVWRNWEPPLGDQQQAAYDAAMAGDNIFITGPGGTGKSEVSKRVVRDLRARGKRVAVCASTGIAALNIGGITLHSFLCLGILGSRFAAKHRMPPSARERAETFVNPCDVILVDEVSMLTGDYIDMMDWWLNEVRHTPDYIPFGGFQVIFVGDFLQLPPVVTKEDEKKLRMRYAFQAPAWKTLKPFYLRTGYRQSDAEFRKHLMRIRRGQSPPDTLAFFNQRHRASLPDGVTPTILVPTNREAEVINNRNLAKLPGEEVVFSAEFSGNPKWIESIKKNMPCDEFLRLKVGAAVICIKNNRSAGYVNGTRGVTEHLDGKTIGVRTDNVVIEVPQEKWELRNSSDTPMAAVEQFPLIHAWAMTVHRMQGQSLDYMMFDPANTFEKAQAYVALSRARSIDGLVLKNKLEDEHVMASNLCARYYEELVEAERSAT